MSIVIGVDAGNYMAKTAGPYGIDSYRTSICDWFQRDFVESFGDGDMEFEIDGRKGYAGPIAEYEDVFGGGGMYGDTKAHEDTKIRTLLALHRYVNMYCPDVNTVKLVTGQPIASHNEVEKNKLKAMLQGSHEFTVNGKSQYLYIEEVGIAAEGTGAFWSNPQMGKIRVIDIGSGTVNAATISNKKIINNASATFNFGMETIGRGVDSMARGIIQETTKLRWERSDIVCVCGAVAHEILPYIQKHYPNSQVMSPLLNAIGGIEITGPSHANAVGFYEIGRLSFK